MIELAESTENLARTIIYGACLVIPSLMVGLALGMRIANARHARWKQKYQKTMIDFAVKIIREHTIGMGLREDLEEKVKSDVESVK